jgi:hypothetical protein
MIDLIEFIDGYGLVKTDPGRAGIGRSAPRKTHQAFKSNLVTKKSERKVKQKTK